MNPLLRVHHLKKYFPIFSGILRRQVGEIKAVDGISFTLYQGQILGIVGETGSGKSTLARAFIRLIEPTYGEVEWKERDLLKMGRKELEEVRRDIQIVFQDPFSSLNPRKIIGDSIGEPLKYHHYLSGHSLEEKVNEVLRQVGLTQDLYDRYPHQLSGGQQQRVCIARALILKPKLIILDEALSALDVSVQAQILNLLLDLKAKFDLSYIFISHDLSIIRHLADYVLILKGGKVVEDAPTQEIFNNPHHPYTKKLLDSILS